MRGYETFKSILPYASKWIRHHLLGQKSVVFLTLLLLPLLLLLLPLLLLMPMLLLLPFLLLISEFSGVGDVVRREEVGAVLAKF